MSGIRAKCGAVHDGQGRMALYLHESVSQDWVVSSVAPRYQCIAIHGEPACVFFDTSIRFFVIIPVFSRQDYIDRPARYHLIADLDWLPGARPGGTPGAANTAGIAGPAGAPGAPDTADPTGAVRQMDGGNALGEDADAAEEMDIDGESQATAGNPGSVEKIPRPPNAWIIFRSEKSKEVRQGNPGTPNGDVSKEVSRLWHAAAQEVRDYYGQMAAQKKEEHMLKYPNYRYRPARK
nr:mating type protein MAT1-1-3 [Diaporthe caulivora]